MQELNENFNVPSFFFYYEKHTMIRYSVGVRENGWNMFEFISKMLQRDNIWSLY